mgnify:CR=1 FL=1
MTEFNKLVCVMLAWIAAVLVLGIGGLWLIAKWGKVV